jgi:tricorn protease-like protein
MPHSIHGEIYIVNKVGAPVYAYDPKTERLASLDSNGLDVVKDYLEQTK